MKKGEKVIIFCAPSGSGKTTMIRMLLQRFSAKYDLCISSTNKEVRDNEVHYSFISTDDFKQAIEHGKFLEYEEVYDNCFYGTPITELERIWSDGKTPILDIDVFGAKKIKSLYQQNALMIFISIKKNALQVLTLRLRKRGEKETTIAKRIQKAPAELIEGQEHCDEVLFNNDGDLLDNVFEELLKILETHNF